MTGWMVNLRVAVRALMRRPGFTAVAVSTMALGLGANTAIFSVVYGALLAPLPYPNADRLVWLSDANKGGWSGNSSSIPNLLDLRDQSHTLQSLGIYGYTSLNLAKDDGADRVNGMAVSPEFFGVLRTPLPLGRDFTPAENRTDAHPVVILGYDLWQRRFGGSPEVLGTEVMLDSRATTVIGVAPPEPDLGNPQAFVLLQWDPATVQRGSRNVNAIARLKTGVTVETADAELKGIFARLAEQYPWANKDWSVDAVPLKDYIVGEGSRRQVLLLGGAALLVLLIACVNVANLLLARAEVRSREIAVRSALGAGRARLVSLFLSESLILSAAGGLLGIVGAYWGVHFLVSIYAGSLPRSNLVTLSGPAVFFGLAASLATGVAVGLFPALRTRMRDVYEGLRDGDRGAAGSVSGLRRVLVVVEVALAVTLVAEAGLLLRSYQAVAAVDVGLESPEQLLTFHLSLPSSAYADKTAITGFFDALTHNLASLPGVEAVGVTSRTPIRGGVNITDMAAGDNPDRMAHFVELRAVDPGFFKAAGIQVVKGRDFVAADEQPTPQRAIITQELARQLFPDEDPVGKTLDGVTWGSLKPTVIGVAADIHDLGPTNAPPPGFYLPLGGPFGVRSLTVLLRARGNPLELTPLVREQVRRLDPALPIFSVQLMSDVLRQAANRGGRQVSMSLILLFGVVALILGAVGIYGVMSYVVAQRTRELGVRMALGARQGEVSRLVLHQGIRMTALGVVLGVAGALASGRLLSSLLYGVRPSDPLTHLTVAALLAAVALFSSWLPARRAARVNPVEALRNE